MVTPAGEGPSALAQDRLPSHHQIMMSVLAQMTDVDGMGGGHWWGWVIGAAVLSVLVAAIVWAVMRLTAHPAAERSLPTRTRPLAEEVLAERFARGEIDSVEYRERLAALRDG